MGDVMNHCFAEVNFFSISDIILSVEAKTLEVGCGVSLSQMKATRNPVGGSRRFTASVSGRCCRRSTQSFV